MQTHQHHGLAGAGRESVPLPVHHRVQPDLRGHPLRHVEEHRPAAAQAAAAAGGAARPPFAHRQHQTLAAPLLGGLRQGAQGPLRRHPRPRAHHHLAHPLLRPHQPPRVEGARRHGGQHLRTRSLRLGHRRHPPRHVAGENNFCQHLFIFCDRYQII